MTTDDEEIQKKVGVIVGGITPTIEDLGHELEDGDE